MTRKVMRILAVVLLAVVLVPSVTLAAEEWSAWAIDGQYNGISFRSRQESGGFLSIQWENRYQQALSWQYKLCYADTWCWEGWVIGIEPGKTTTHGNYHQKSHGRLTEWALWNVKPYPPGR